jgi:hypothetical protein
MAFTSATPVATQQAAHDAVLNLARQWDIYMCVLNPALIPALITANAAVTAALSTLTT